eukprot:193115-Prymnesium_polylepis.1
MVFIKTYKHFETHAEAKHQHTHVICTVSGRGPRARRVPSSCDDFAFSMRSTLQSMSGIKKPLH